LTARKMGRIQAYEYWSEQYHSARRLVDALYRITQGQDRTVGRQVNGVWMTVDRQAKATRMLPLAMRRKARLYAKALAFEKPTPRTKAARP